MKIVFGHNNYCRKTVQPHELGILTPLEDIKHFELTQRYAHLYWIPFFPIGLSWNARAKDGKLYKLNAGFEQHLKHIRYSWASILIAFIGPILILGGGGIYSLNNMYKEHKWKVRRETEQQKEYDQKAALITQPGREDYYHFSGERSQYAKVVGSNDTALLLSAAVLELRGDNPAEIIALLEDSTRNLPPVWVTKKTLLKMAKPQTPFDTTLFDLGTFYLTDIQRLGEPLFEYSFHMSSVEGFEFSLRNIGTDVYITAIDKMQTDMEWDQPLPDTIAYDKGIDFDINFNPKVDVRAFKFVISCKDRKNKSFNYLVSGKGSPDNEVVLTKQP
jgi:hypothetical protein